MKMKKFIELKRKEQFEIETLFTSWLRCYTHEVITNVISKTDEIINNEFAMNLIRELHKRQIKEQKEFETSLSYLMKEFEEFKEFDVHSHPTTHSQSYRDVLYDMYIK